MAIVWAAVLDGDIDGADKRANREAAEADAAWLRLRPSTIDRARFDRGGVVRVVRVEECEWTGEWVEVV
jgi:hypothetical protein